MRGQKFIPLLVIAAGLLAYHNSFTGAFVFDDVQSIQENPTIRHLWPIWQVLSPPHRGGATVEGRPLINLSLAINHAIGGYNVCGYHALNVTVHILAGLTLLGIVRRTLRQPILGGRFGAAADALAAAVAVLWTVHPLHVESVTYVIQRAESMMGLFYLLTLYCFIRGTESPRRHLWYGLSVSACALGMASKEVMVSAPLMMLLYDRTFLSDSFREAWRHRWPLYLALASTWILLVVVMVTAQLPATLANAQKVGLSPWVYLLNQPGVMLDYLRLSVWPHPLSLDHAWPMVRTWMNALPSTIVILLLLGATGWALKMNSGWGFVGAWFFLILAPTSSIMPLRSAMQEHRMYLSLAAVVSLMVMAIYSLTGRRCLAVFALIAITLGVLTWRRNQDYRSEVAIWQDAVANFPNGPSAHYNLGVAQWRAGRVQEAIAQYEQALRIRPDYAEAHNNLGVALEKEGAEQEAMEHYEVALQINPDNARAHFNLGFALMRAGKIDKSIRFYEQALRLDPNSAEAHYNLGVALEHTGNITDATGHYELALRFNPDYAEAHHNLGNVLYEAGRAAEAMEHYQQALRIRPDYAEAHYNLGVTLWERGNHEEAITQYEEALRIKPDYAEAHNNLGFALGQLGRVPEAVGHYEQALRIDPHLAEAHFNLGVVLEQLGRTTEAIAYYEQALRLRPDFTAAQEGLTRLRPAR